jgi:hypothetical protein
LGLIPKPRSAALKKLFPLTSLRSISGHAWYPNEASPHNVFRRRLGKNFTHSRAVAIQGRFYRSSRQDGQNSARVRPPEMEVFVGKDSGWLGVAVAMQTARYGGNNLATPPAD